MLPIDEIIEWDIPNWSKLIQYWEPTIKCFPLSSKILTVGERNGGITLWLALNGYDVICTDREGPTVYAYALHKKYGVSDKIKYASFDLVASPPEFEKYDLIIAKSVLGGLKLNYGDSKTRNAIAQELAIKNMHKLLNAGGTVLFAENLKGTLLLHYLRRLVGKHRGWYYFKRNEIENLFKKFSSIEVKTFGVVPSVFPYRILNRFVVFVNEYILCVLPASFKYIAFIKAVK